MGIFEVMIDAAVVLIKDAPCLFELILLSLELVYHIRPFMDGEVLKSLMHVNVINNVFYIYFFF